MTDRSPTDVGCVNEKGVTIYRSTLDSRWERVTSSDQLPRPNALANNGFQDPDLYVRGVVATDPWLQVASDGTLYLGIIVTVGSPDCSEDWPAIAGTGFKSGDDLNTAGHDGLRYDDIQLWELRPEPGAVLTKIATARADQSVILGPAGHPVSQVSLETQTWHIDHPRFAINPDGDIIVVTIVRSGGDRTRTLVRGDDGLWNWETTQRDNEDISHTFTDGTGFKFPHPTFGPDGNLFVAYVSETHGAVVRRFVPVQVDGQGLEWAEDSTVSPGSPGLPPPPAGTTYTGLEQTEYTTYTDPMGNSAEIPADATPGLVVTRLGNNAQPVVHLAYTFRDGTGAPTVALTSANSSNVKLWTPHIIAGRGFGPTLSVSGAANTLDLLMHRDVVASTALNIEMYLQRRRASDPAGGGLLELQLSQVPIPIAAIPGRRPTITNKFYGEYEGLATKGDTATIVVPTLGPLGDADLQMGSVITACNGTVEEITSSSHPDHAWECDCLCGGSTTSMIACVPADVDDLDTACSLVCADTDCGESLQCTLDRRCSSTGSGRLKMHHACRRLFSPGTGPNPSLYADYYAVGTSQSHASLVLDGESAGTGMSGSVSLNVSTSPPAAGSRVEISRLELRPSSFHVGGFLGAKVRDIKLIHVNRLHGTLVDDTHFVIPAHTARFATYLRVDPDGPSLAHW